MRMEAERMTLVLVNLAGIMEKADESILPGVYKEVGEALHTDPTGLGSLTLLRSIVQSACYPLAVYLSARHNRAHVISLGAFLWASATFLVAFSSSFSQVAVSRALNGIGLAIVAPAIQSLVADSTNDSNRGTAFGWLQLTANLGSILGGLCSVLIAPLTFMGIPGWRISFHLVEIISVVVGILVRLYAKDPLFPNSPKHPVSEMAESQGEVKREPIFRDIRRYNCKFCGESRSKKALLTTHMQKEHPDEFEKQKDQNLEEENEGKKLNDRTCEECGATFKKPAHLEQHMKIHSNEKPFVCTVDDCCSSFKRKYHLERHMNQHEGKLFKCPIEGCNKELSVYGNMARHVKEMHQGKPTPSNVKEKMKHLCPEVGCGKEFKFPSQLRDHLLFHVKLDSEAICADPACMQRFPNIESLREHTRSCHQYIKCDVCGCMHLRKNIKRHLRSHEEHPHEVFQCQVEGCNASYTTKYNLRIHVEAVHLNLKPFFCRVPGCGESFALKHVRDRHETSSCHYVHGDLEEFDEQFRSKPRGGRKRAYPTVETLLRKRVTPPNQDDGVLNGSDYISWLLSTDSDE